MPDRRYYGIPLGRQSLPLISELNKNAYVHIEDWQNWLLQGRYNPYVYIGESICAAAGNVSLK